MNILSGSFHFSLRISLERGFESFQWNTNELSSFSTTKNAKEKASTTKLFTAVKEAKIS